MGEELGTEVVTSISILISEMDRPTVPTMQFIFSVIERSIIEFSLQKLRSLVFPMYQRNIILYFVL